MQDKWASLVHGRPSHISTIDWAVHSLTEQDFPESFADEDDEDGSTEVVNGRSIFTCMTSLTVILSEILSTLYSGTADEEAVGLGSDATTHVLTKAKSLQIRLKEWYSAMPGCLDIGHVKVRKLSSSGYLHLAYWATEITLHRCITRTLPSCSDPHLVSICYAAALARSKSAMDFVKSLRPEHWQGFWYFASEYSFGLIGLFELLVSSSVATGHDRSESIIRLDQYRWSLKMASQNAVFLEKSIAMMNTASADQSTRMRSLRGSKPRPREENTRVDQPLHRAMELMHTDALVGEDIQRRQWSLAQAAVMDEFQMDYDQVSWQDGFYDIGHTIDR